MFKDLVTAVDSGNLQDIRQFFERFNQFAFAPMVRVHFNLAWDTPIPVTLQKAVLEFILYTPGLGYASIPKGAIHFHRYSDGQLRTAFEEHFHEAARYAGTNEKVHLHFTIPNELRLELDVELQKLSASLSSLLKRNFIVNTSVQNPESDTPACYDDTLEWVQQPDQTLLRRPAGHGALLENLNQLDADLIFVKNIDNIVPDNRKEQVVIWRKALAGLLFDVQKLSFEILRTAESGKFDKDKAVKFIANWLHRDVLAWTDEAICDLLNRPWRICGMVPNEGEPGGGPFVVEDTDGTLSLQIVEKAQIDLADAEQKSILENATHFNPVDLVLGTKNYQGQSFDLMKYSNTNTGMRVFKTHEGKPIRALELPGLWNGSMHYWNTIFVEVPIATFNPVKTVFDLLRPAHQAE